MKSLLKRLGVMIVCWLIDQTSDEEIRYYGDEAGRWLTDNAREQFGDSWENIESKLQYKSAVFMGGVQAGLDYDDKGGE